MHHRRFEIYPQMSSSNSSSRYSSFNNRSSAQSDPSSSTELNQTKNRRQIPDVSYALAKSKSAKNEQNFSAMVKKFMEKKSSSTSSSSKLKGKEFVVAADVTNIIAHDLKKKMTMTARRGGTSGFGGLHKKLFGSKVKGEESEKKKKVLTEVKVNTRSLAMVLRSERELLSLNKDQESEIMELKLMLDERNREVDKLKDLCLEQREEIKALKSVILFPDVTNSQQDDSELKEAKEIIPTLQRQVTSLTGQLQCLAHDLAEVKADKYSATRFSDSVVSSPKTPTYEEQEEALNSLEFSSGDHTTHGSADDMFLEDLNPCLTPYIKSNSKAIGYISYSDDSSYNNIKKSWVDRQHGNSANSARILGRATRRSDESKCTYRKNV